MVLLLDNVDNLLFDMLLFRHPGHLLTIHFFDHSVMDGVVVYIPICIGILCCVIIITICTTT